MKSSEKSSSHQDRFFVSGFAVGGAGFDGGGEAGFAEVGGVGGV